MMTIKVNKPFFSIVVPTRNRPELLAAAIRSVLAQSFSDYELIISDNSDPGLRASGATGPAPEWMTHPRVRYVRTPAVLPMPEHFDFATNLAAGTYVAILTDRMVMRPSSLAILAEKILTHKTGQPDLVSWNMQSSFSELSGLETTPGYTGKAEIIDSKKMLADFVAFSSWRTGDFYLSKLPRGLNSVYKRTLALEIMDRHGRLFPPLSPDYTSAFFFLAYAKEVLYLDLPLYMSHGTKSNGLKCSIYGVRDLNSSLDPFEGCLLSVDTVFNSVVRDFLKIRRVVHPQLQEFEINIVGYFLLNYRELILKELMGSPMDLKSLYRLWADGVAKLPLIQQKEIEDGKVILEKLRPAPLSKFKQKLFRRYGIGDLRDKLLAIKCRWAHLRNGGRVYHDVQEAAQATDVILRERCGNPD